MRQARGRRRRVVVRGHARRTRPPPPGRRRWPYLAVGFTGGVLATLAVRSWWPGSSQAPTVPPPAPQPAAAAALGPSDRQPRFEFYALLPETEVEVGEPGPSEVHRRRIYQLQAGSFRRLGEAEALRARLAMLGLEARSEEVRIAGEIWYRVLMGPIATTAALHRAQARLAGADIESIPLLVGMERAP